MGRGSPHVGKRMAQVDQNSSLIVASRFTQRILSCTQNFTQALTQTSISFEQTLITQQHKVTNYIVLRSSMVLEVQELVSTNNKAINDVVDLPHMHGPKIG